MLEKFWRWRYKRAREARIRRQMRQIRAFEAFKERWSEHEAERREAKRRLTK
jgi:hypothetical protein